MPSRAIRRVIRFWLGLLLPFSSSLHATPDFVPAASAYHAYIDAKIILSLELTAKKEAFVEIVNLGDTRRCLSIENINLRTEDGKSLDLIRSYMMEVNPKHREETKPACVNAPSENGSWAIVLNLLKRCERSSFSWAIQLFDSSR